MGLINISQTSIKTIIRLCIAPSSVENIRMCLRLKWGNRRDGTEGNLKKHYKVFDRRAILKNSQTVLGLLNFKEWKSLCDGYRNNGRGVREAYQHYYENWEFLHEVLEKPCWAGPVQTLKNTEQSHLQPAWNPATFFQIPQDRSTCRSLLWAILRAINKQDNFNVFFSLNCLFVSSQERIVEINCILDFWRTLWGRRIRLWHRSHQNH